MIPVEIPALVDTVLYNVLRKICLMGISYSDIIKVGTTAQLPNSGRRIFFYSTDDKQWFAYTADAALGKGGWVTFG